MKGTLFVCVFFYVAAICAANTLVWWLGPWWSPINSLLLIGLDLSLRDRVHERHGFAYSLVLVAAGGGVSCALNPAAGQIAAASLVAFTAAGVADGAVYQALRRFPPLTKMNGSNVVGAAVDSVLFPTIAFGAFMPHIVVLQFAAKVLGGALWAWGLTRKW